MLWTPRPSWMKPIPCRGFLKPCALCAPSRTEWRDPHKDVPQSAPDPTMRQFAHSTLGVQEDSSGRPACKIPKEGGWNKECDHDSFNPDPDLNKQLHDCCSIAFPTQFSHITCQ